MGSARALYSLILYWPGGRRVWVPDLWKACCVVATGANPADIMLEWPGGRSVQPVQPKNSTVKHRRRSGCMNYSHQWREKRGPIQSHMWTHVVRLTRWAIDGRNLTAYRALEREQEDKWTGFRGRVKPNTEDTEGQRGLMAFYGGTGSLNVLGLNRLVYRYRGRGTERLNGLLTRHR